ncbi:MAG: alpha/beta hydrolase [Promethearchaeota archaeon]
MQFVIKILKERKQQAIQQRVKQARDGLEELSKLAKIPKDIKVEIVKINEMEAEWIVAPESVENKITLYLHGGGYISGSLNSHRELAARLARFTKTKVLTIDYRLAPEHPFPEGLEDATSAYQWLIEIKITLNLVDTAFF